MRRIVFSIGFSRQWSPALLVFKSTQSRWNFYKKILRGSFHTAGVKNGKAQGEHMISALPLIAEMTRPRRHVGFLPTRDMAPCSKWNPSTLREECNEASSQNLTGRRRCNSRQRGTGDLMRHEAAKGG